MRERGEAGIRTATEEYDMPNRYLTSVATDDIPRGSRYRVQQNEGAEPLLERRREQQRIGDGYSESDAGPERALHHVFPMRPWGRNHSTAIKSV